jgi:hypothetical protein
MRSVCRPQGSGLGLSRVCVVDNGHRIDPVGVHDRGDARERRIRQNARCPVIEGGPHRGVLHVTGSLLPRCDQPPVVNDTDAAFSDSHDHVADTAAAHGGPGVPQALAGADRDDGLLITVSAVTTSSSGEGVLTIGLESGRRQPGSVAARSARGRPIDASGTHAARDGRSLRDCRPRPPRAGCRRVFRQWTTT